MENCGRFVFYNNIDSFWRPFPLKFLGKSRAMESENKPTTIIDRGFWPISARESFSLVLL